MPHAVRSLASLLLASAARAQQYNCGAVDPKNASRCLDPQGCAECGPTQLCCPPLESGRYLPAYCCQDGAEVCGGYGKMNNRQDGDDGGPGLCCPEDAWVCGPYHSTMSCCTEGTRGSCAGAYGELCPSPVETATS